MRKEGDAMSEGTFAEFKEIIDHAVDREELEDIRRMILEESDLSFREKEKLTVYLSSAWERSPELRATKAR